MESGERVTLESEQPPAADSAQIRAKFRALAAPVFGPANADAVIAVVDDLERLPDVQPLLRLLRHALAEAA